MLLVVVDSLVVVVVVVVVDSLRHLSCRLVGEVHRCLCLMRLAVRLFLKLGLPCLALSPSAVVVFNDDSGVGSDFGAGTNGMP